jgi:hypothetical protein
VTVGSHAALIVEYPCELFCRIEVELNDERPQITLEQLREKADGLHRRVHEPDLAETEPEAEAEAEAEAAVADPHAARRPAATVFRSAPGRGVDRRR